MYDGSVALPSRTYVCLACRSLFAKGETCDGGRGHTVVDLGIKKGRRALVRTVWGESARLKAKEVARAGGTGAGIGTAGQALDCGGCGSCGDVGGAGDLGELLIGILIVIAFAFVAVALYFVIKWIVLFVRRKMNEPRAKGAAFAPPELPSEGNLLGRVAGPAELAAPIGGEACVAFGVELVERRLVRRDVMLRDARTCGFDVALDDGRTLRVPAGRIHLEGPFHRASRAVLPEVEPYVQAIDTQRTSDEALAPIPFDEVGELFLAPGDHVEIAAEVDTVPDPTRATGYRDAALALAPVGVPRVRLTAKGAA